MPNWCFNSVLITGEPDTIVKVKEQLNKPFTKVHDSWNQDTNTMEQTETTYSNPVFAFHNIYNHKQAGITDEEYIQQPKSSELGVGHKDWWKDTQEIAKTDKSWYNWNITNWGTKWDVAVHDEDKYPETELVEESSESLFYRINTAWSPPVPIILKLSEQYPDLTINLEYEEESGWGGEYQFDKGFITEVNSYTQKCNNCDETSDDDFPFCEDCDSSVCPSCKYTIYQGGECGHKILV